jgi:hypothetical protein
MVKSTVPELNRSPLKKPVSVVTKTNKPFESRIDDAFSRELLTVTWPDSRR